MKSFQKSSDNSTTEIPTMSANHTIKSKGTIQKDTNKSKLKQQQQNEEETKIKNNEKTNLTSNMVKKKKKEKKMVTNEEENNNDGENSKEEDNEDEDIEEDSEGEGDNEGDDLPPDDVPSQQGSDLTIPNTPNDTKKNKVVTPPPNLSIFRGGVVSRYLF